MNKEHPAYAAIIAWANGETIQYKHLDSEWAEWEDWDTMRSGTPWFTRYDMVFRTKPKMRTIHYKTFLRKSVVRNKVCVDIIEKDACERMYNQEGCDDFVCWLDDEWQEVEVEILEGEEE